MNRKVWVFILIILFIKAQAQYDFTPITKLLTDSIEIIGQAGQNCGFMIIEGERVIYEQYLGNWNANTYQPIASGSKMASMVLMMQLIDEGYLSYSDTVQRFLPSFSNYSVTFTSDEDCEVFSDNFNLIITGLDQYQEKELSTIFPNPFMDKINTRPYDYNDEATLINLQGNIIWKGRHIHEIDFSYLAKGVYLLKLCNQFHKIIKI